MCCHGFVSIMCLSQLISRTSILNTKRPKQEFRNQQLSPENVYEILSLYNYILYIHCTEMAWGIHCTMYIGVHTFINVH